MVKPHFATLSKDDVRVLVRHPDPNHRAGAALRICHMVRKGSLNEFDRKFARKLMNYMADDAVAIVRRSLAVTLKNSPELPRDLALKLAADIDNIALPIIESSPVLTDDDLIEILRSKASAKIRAIAKRPNVSGDLVKAIIRYGDSQAVAEVAANDGAIIDRDTADQILAIYYDDDLIKEAFISRRDLPITVMEKLITIVSEETALLLQERHDLPVDMAVKLANRARERASITIVTEDISDRDVEKFVKRLVSEGRLTESVIIRAAGLGRMKFLTYAMSQLAQISPNKTALMLYDSGPFGLQALCGRAGFSDIHEKIIRSACLIFRDLESSGIDYDEVYFQTLMVQRMLTLPFDLPESDQDWFLERLDGFEVRAA